MQMNREALNQAWSEGILTENQATQLWNWFETKYLPEHVNVAQDSVTHKTRSKFNGANVAYYFGAMLVISAMTWFMTTAWNDFVGWGIFLIAIAYAAIFVLLGCNLWFKQRLEVPGGLLYTLAVCMTPLAIFGLQNATGLWLQGAQDDYTDFYHWVKGSWIFMGIGTLIAGVVALKYVRFPFLLAPISFVLWYMSMDLTPILFGKDSYSWDERLWFSLIFGLGMIIVAYMIDRRTQKDYAFWLYLFGSFSFWSGLGVLFNSWRSGPTLDELVFLGINLLFMVIAILLQRRVLMVFASIGVFSYIGMLATKVFASSALFPVVLSGIGLTIIFFGVFYQKNHKRIESSISALVPDGMKNLLPSHRFDR